MEAKSTNEQTYRELKGHVWAIENLIKDDNFISREINHHHDYDSGTYRVKDDYGLSPLGVKNIEIECNMVSSSYHRPWALRPPTDLMSEYHLSITYGEGCKLNWPTSASQVLCRSVFYQTLPLEFS